MSRLFRRFRFCLLVSGLLSALSALPAAAEDLFGDRFELHGYGHQAFLLSNSFSNADYLHADPHGSFRLNALALLLSFKATDDLTIWSQLFADNESKLRLDWAFVDYRVNDWLRIRGGQIKAPLGLLNEIRDIKHILHSTLEPAIYQETTGLMFEAFRGASAELDYGGVFGEVKLDLFGGAPVFFEGDEAGETHYGLIGGRLTYDTPLPGLSIGATIAATREKEVEETGEVVSGTKTLAGGSLEYQQAGLHVQGEYFQLRGMEHKKQGYYGEVAYTFGDRLTPFVRYDYFTLDKDQKSDPTYHQKDFVFGIGYKFNNYVSLKVEDHIISGYALPQMAYGERNHEAIEAGTVPPTVTGDRRWNLFAASLNFMF